MPPSPMAYGVGISQNEDFLLVEDVGLTGASGISQRALLFTITPIAVRIASRALRR